MNFSYLDPKENVSIPPPMDNHGIYAEKPKSKSEWAKNYDTKRIEPDAVKYSSTFFELAQGHIPTGNRPGNNTIMDDKFTITSLKYNTLCYNH